MYFDTHIKEYYAKGIKTQFEIDAILRYKYPMIDIDKLDDDRWVKLYAEYLFISKHESLKIKDIK